VTCRDLLWIPHDASLEKSVQERVRGKDLTPSLAGAALLFFSLESLLAAWRRREA
jgi:hypothetical protein